MIEIVNTPALGDLIRNRRTSLGLRQQDLALAANVGVRFIVDIENGKETSQIGLVIRLLQSLGIKLTADMSPAPTARAANEETDAFDPDNFTPSP
jgi:HTH-type transcriptional regulator/antitoxin HipB